MSSDHSLENFTKQFVLSEWCWLKKVLFSHRVLRGWVQEVGERRLNFWAEKIAPIASLFVNCLRFWCDFDFRFKLFSLGVSRHFRKNDPFVSPITCPFRFLIRCWYRRHNVVINRHISSCCDAHWFMDLQILVWCCNIWLTDCINGVLVLTCPRLYQQVCTCQLDLLSLLLACC